MLIIMILLYQITNAMKSVSQVYYAGWVVNGNAYGEFASIQAKFTMIAMAPMGPALLVLLPLFKKFGREKVIIVGSLMTILGCTTAFIGAGSTGMVYGGTALGSLGVMTFVYSLMTFIGDSIDHVEYSQMAHAALQCLPTPPAQGIVVTKYGHVLTDLPGIRCLEAGHPVPDENSFAATQAVLDMTAELSPADTMLFLLSGGGSALFEKSLVPGAELQAITRQLLACGADIVEMNTIRKRLSAVKGGRFAAHCAPAKVQTIVLSDILGDPPDMIASGPAAPDLSTCDEALKIAEKYDLQLSPAARTCLGTETPRHLDNVQMQIIGSVRELCAAAAAQCRALGYEPLYLTDRLNCEAREAGRFLAAIARSHADDGKKLAFIAGGETVVRLTGNGLGGRNQEIALAAAENLSGLSNAAVISVGSDGTDGPIDAAGGYADGGTQAALASAGWNITDALRQNDAYHALQSVNGLVHTGPTGTNVNDVAIVLVGK